MSERGPFRKESLDRLASPDRLDDLLAVTTPRSWLPLATLGVLVALLGIWSVRGTIPETVEGRGILVRPRNVVELQSAGAGRLRELTVRVGDRVRPGQVVGRIELPELEKRLELQRDKRAELEAHARTADILDLRGPAAAQGAQGLAAHVARSRAVAERLRDQELAALAREGQVIEELLAGASALAQELERKVASYESLHGSGVIAEHAVIEARIEQLDARARASDLETRRLELQARELAAKDAYFARLQRISDLSFDVENHEQGVADVQREIARLEAQLAEEGLVVAESAGRVIEVSAVVGQFLAPGDRLGAVAGEDGGPTLASLVFFTVGDGKRIEKEMKIHVTPDTVERERYGGILGRVREVSDYPVTLGEAEALVGNREMAELLVAGGYRIGVQADLLRDPGEPGQLLWSAHRAPGIPITAGTTATARVTVQERRPIGFLLPSLKKWTGTD
jgi:HlyD family secretion protein